MSTSEDAPVQLRVADDVAHITLNRPAKRNALDETALAALSSAYDEAERAGVRALLLTGNGKAFCAGRDISGVDPATDDAYGYLHDRVTPVLRRIADFPAPTFAVAHGHCLGVGLGLLIVTDVVYVAESAKIGSTFANLGATLDSGGHAFFVERLGTHRTLDLIYTAYLMSGREAVEAGLFSRVLPDDEVHDFAARTAAQVAKGATKAFRASKRLVAQLRDERVGLWTSLEAESKAQGELCSSEDYAEGFTAFQEKRPPVFKG